MTRGAEAMTDPALLNSMARLIALCADSGPEMFNWDVIARAIRETDAPERT